MVAVSRMILYTLTDVLELPFEFNPGTGQLHGEKVHTIHFGTLPVSFNSRIVSSCVLDDGSVVVFLRIKGNLALIAHSYQVKTQEMATVHLLNLAKMDKIEGWLEKHRPKEIGAVEAALHKAIVRSFRKEPKTKWQPLTIRECNQHGIENMDGG